MRKVIVAAFISLDGIMQAPGGPEEDPTGGFAFGGWVTQFWDDVIGGEIDKSFSEPFDLLLGRRTYDIFAAHWPYVEFESSGDDFDALNAGIAETFDRLAKYVLTHRPESLTWKNSVALGDDPVDAVRKLKQGDGPALMTQGSTELLALLFANDLVDELRISTFPVVLGHGKSLFADTAMPRSFELQSSIASTTGVVHSVYRRGGEVKTGSFGMEPPTEAELERRRTLT